MSTRADWLRAEIASARLYAQHMDAAARARAINPHLTDASRAEMSAATRELAADAWANHDDLLESLAEELEAPWPIK